MNCNEGMDTYSMGNNIYTLLTGLWPFYQYDPDVSQYKFPPVGLILVLLIAYACLTFSRSSRTLILSKIFLSTTRRSLLSIPGIAIEASSNPV
jgi:hypothetical protein